MRAIDFKEDILYLIDQRRLPIHEELFECKTHSEVEYAIREMVVRGAPAIGATAAYGVVLAAKEFMNDNKEDFLGKMNDALDFINKSRPTAVNLMWAIKRMRNKLSEYKDLDTKQIYTKLKEEADIILKEDIQTNKQMARHGNEVIPKGATILTHCNTGALATAGYGTALGVIREAHYTGKDIFVYADETRPRLQGGRLTAWELVKENIPAKLVADNAAATLIRDGKIDVILVGADRIALNGDTANKIGTFMLSVIAKRYNVPFYIVAPVTTIDFDIETGEDIEIEERSSEEVTHVFGNRVAPMGIDVYNPAFDVTPHENITGIITEEGILKPPFKESIIKIKK
ncbi:S-methyl-5-thioribose-1-phosphate isomerase [Clostridiaceae bacterium M8S5]|nr:S-methyl-5-thioribose-1-phosphate isomerase [Clostridiaceae bacterium M8S5]